MKKLEVYEMEAIEAGGFWGAFKCILGLTLIAGGVAAGLSGVGIAAAGGAIGGGAALVNSNCNSDNF